ncbi:hypothetical protein [Nocardia sp. NBC_00416]|uniref:hypothetical protein n=1 Tax=Nocardia sp. NBC_00416 TaxID=2975991 RepID=UPI002E1D29B0
MRIQVRTIDVRALCELYEVPREETVRALDLAAQAKVTSWYTAFAGLYSDPTFNMYVELLHTMKCARGNC